MENSSNFKWVRQAGHNLIKNVSISFVSDNPAHPDSEKEYEIYNDWNSIYYDQYRMNDSGKKGWDRLIGCEIDIEKTQGEDEIPINNEK